MNKKVLIGVGVAVIALVGLLWWATGESYKPLPGKEVADLGREHITDISKIKYNSNPPTSGSHFPIWAKRGVYDRVLSDGYLLHSLEHGYIVVSYNCMKLNSKLSASWRTQNSKLIRVAYAHEGEVIEKHPDATSSAGILLMKMKANASGEMSPFTPKNPPPVEVPLPDSFKTKECKQLVSDLSLFLKDWQRIVIVPRLNLDTPIALTAWDHIEKLEKFDTKRIQEFISTYHNKGPEATVE